MKTFETEKHNIPEGATHYSDECENYHFTWFAECAGGEVYLLSNSTKEWKLSLFGRDLKPIPQSKEVEWVNGDDCRYANDVEHAYIYVGEHPHGDGHYVFSEEKGITYIANGYLLEQETQEDRERREREELIRKMIDDFTEQDLDCNYRGKVAKVCAALYDAGYRKGGE